jgi:hypothetical protein
MPCIIAPVGASGRVLRQRLIAAGLMRISLIGPTTRSRHRCSMTRRIGGPLEIQDQIPAGSGAAGQDVSFGWRVDRFGVVGHGARQQRRLAVVAHTGSA